MGDGKAVSIKLDEKTIGASIELLTELARYGTAALAAKGKTQVENAAEVRSETEKLLAERKGWRKG